LHVYFKGVERPYDCYICDKKFQRHNGLSEHLRTIHKLPKVNCSVSNAQSNSSNRGHQNNMNDSSSPDRDEDWVPPVPGGVNESETSDETPAGSKKFSLKSQDSSEYHPKGIPILKQCQTSEPKKKRRPSILPIKQRARVTQIFRCSHEGCAKVFHLEAQRNGHVKQAHEG